MDENGKLTVTKAICVLKFHLSSLENCGLFFSDSESRFQILPLLAPSQTTRIALPSPARPPAIPLTTVQWDSQPLPLTTVKLDLFRVWILPPVGIRAEAGAGQLALVGESVGFAWY